jgi:CBS domain-containing protein
MDESPPTAAEYRALTLIERKVNPMRAKDVMTANVISVTEEAPVHEIVRLLMRYRISAVPVVDGAGKVVGIVSEGDLLRPEGGGPWWLDAAFTGRSVSFDKAHGRTAGVIMTRNVVIVDEETPLNQIAELLERHHIKRVPVIKDGRLTGIVSRANLLHGLASTIIEHHEPAAAKDRQIRDGLVKTLLERHGLDTVVVNVTVTEGNVRLWGVVENAEQAALAERAAKALPGVRSVENHLGLGPISGVPV